MADVSRKPPATRPSAGPDASFPPSAAENRATAFAPSRAIPSSPMRMQGRTQAANAGSMLARVMLAALACATPAAAQPSAPPAEWQPIVRNLTRAEFWQFFEPDPSPSAGDPETAHIGNRLFAGVRWRRGRLDATAALQYVQLGGLPADAIGPGTLGTGALYYDHAGDTSSSQVYLRTASLALRGIADRLDVQVGRFGYTSGAERASRTPKIESVKRLRIDSRLIGEFEWSLYQRSFDGLRADWRTPTWTLTGIALRPTQGGFEDAAGVGIEDVGVSSAVWTAAPGLLIPRTEVQAFAARYTDGRAVTARPDNTGLRAAAVDVGVTTFGGHTVSALPVRTGELDVLTWFAVQTGEWYEQSHRGMGWSVEAGHQWPKAPGAPWVRGGLLRTSGDDNPADGHHGTFFPMLPTVRRYSQSTLTTLANNRDVFAQIIVRPTAALTARVDIHALALASAADGWYGGSGATQEEGRIFGYTVRPSGGQQRVTNVLEASMEWRIHSRWTAAAYGAAATAGPVVRRSFRDRPAAFFYLESHVFIF